MALRFVDRAKRHFRAFELASGALLAIAGLLFITGHAGSLLEPAAVDTKASVNVAPSSAPVTCGADVSAPLHEAALPAAVRSEPMPTMIEFVSANCPICHRMAPVVAKAEQDCSAHGVRVQRVDVATVAGREGVKRYGILGVPTFVFADRQGAEVARLVGEQPVETLIQTLEVLAGETCDGFHRLGVVSSPGS